MSAGCPLPLGRAQHPSPSGLPVAGRREWFGARKEAARRFERAVAMDSNAQRAARACRGLGTQARDVNSFHRHARTNTPKLPSRATALLTHAKLPRTPADLQTCGPLVAHTPTPVCCVHLPPSCSALARTLAARSRASVLYSPARRPLVRALARAGVARAATPVMFRGARTALACSSQGSAFDLSVPPGLKLLHVGKLFGARPQSRPQAHQARGRSNFQPSKPASRASRRVRNRSPAGECHALYVPMAPVRRRNMTTRHPDARMSSMGASGTSG